MDLSAFFDPAQLIANLFVGVLAFAVLHFLVESTRRAIAFAVLITLAVSALYPGGAAGLLSASLAPMRDIAGGAEVRKQARSSTIDAAVGDKRPARGDDE